VSVFEQARSAIRITDLLEISIGDRPSKILCPMHDDRVKSAVVYPEDNTVFCFRDRETYDVIDLVEAREGLPSKLAAAKWILDRAGLVYEDRRASPADEFWRLAKDPGPSVPSSRAEAYALRWSVHATVLALVESPSWDAFDEALTVAELRSWRDLELAGGGLQVL